MFLSDLAALQRLALSLEESEHVRKLEHLDFIIAEDETIDAIRMETVTEKVVRTLRTVHQQLPNGCLKHMSIRLRADNQLRGWDWRRAWRVSACGWAVLIRSLTESGLFIHELEAFVNSPGSISLDLVYPSVPSTALARCFSRVRSLDLSLSPSPEDAYHDRLEDISDDSSEDETDDNIQSVERSQEYCNRLCEFVNLCQDLQHLGLHWYSLSYEDSTPLIEQQKVFDYVVRRCTMSNLRSVSLKGIHTTHASLLQLAEKSQLRSVEMDYTFLKGNDTFRAFFDHITPNLESVKLSHLFEEVLIKFEDGDLRQPSQEWMKEGASSRQPLKYHQCWRPPNGELEVMQELGRQRREYGPPGRAAWS